LTVDCADPGRLAAFWGARVIELGGRDTGERHEYPEGTVVVLHDPESNEFCIVRYQNVEERRK
jgi:predicted enzyme related to lactoylglutathione lyase